MKKLFFVLLFLLHSLQAADDLIDPRSCVLIGGSVLHVGVNPNFNSDQVVAGVAPHGGFEWCVAVNSSESAKNMEQFFAEEEIGLHTFQSELEKRFCILRRIVDAIENNPELAQQIKDRRDAIKEESKSDEDSFNREVADAKAVGIDLAHIPKSRLTAMGLLLCDNKCLVFNCEYGIEPSNFMAKFFRSPFLVDLYPEWKPDLFFQLNKKQVSSALEKVAELVNDRRYKEAAEEHFKTSDVPVLCMFDQDALVALEEKDQQQEIEERLQPQTEVSLTEQLDEKARFLIAALLLMRAEK